MNSFPINIIQFSGGLGNQMFQYSFYKAFKRNNPRAICCIDTRGCENHHNGYEIDSVFTISTRRQRILARILKKVERLSFISFQERTENSPWKYQSDILFTDSHIFSIISGFFQTEKYFSEIRTDIIHCFSFRYNLLSKKTKSTANILLRSSNTFSIHIRRGDYVSISDTHTYHIDYYQHAIDLLRKNALTERGTAYVFSDDPDWVKKNLHIDADTIFIDWNRGTDSWQDMYLMSLCKHNVIANSSFSWWGAWLNQNPDKVVIAPKKWMTYEDTEIDIIPDGWIRL